MVNSKATMQNTPNSQKTEWVPMASDNQLNVRVSMKPSDQQKLAVNADATDLRLVGKISPIIAHGSGPKPGKNSMKFNLWV